MGYYSIIEKCDITFTKEIDQSLSSDYEELQRLAKKLNVDVEASPGAQDFQALSEYWRGTETSGYLSLIRAGSSTYTLEGDDEGEAKLYYLLPDIRGLVRRATDMGYRASGYLLRQGERVEDAERIYIEDGEVKSEKAIRSWPSGFKEE